MAGPRKLHVPALPAKAWQNMSDDEVRVAAAELHGFDVVHAGKLLAAWRKMHPNASLPQRKVVAALEAQATETLSLMTPVQLSHIRWWCACQEALTAVNGLQGWERDANIWRQEMLFDAGRSTGGTTGSYHRAAENTQQAIRLLQAFRDALAAAAPRTPDDTPGDRLARWQAMLKCSGMRPEVIISFFVPPPDWPQVDGRHRGLKDNTVPAMRKRVRLYLQDTDRREQLEAWFASVTKRRRG